MNIVTSFIHQLRQAYMVACQAHPDLVAGYFIAIAVAFVAFAIWNATLGHWNPDRRVEILRRLHRYIGSHVERAEKRAERVWAHAREEIKRRIEAREAKEGK